MADVWQLIIQLRSLDYGMNLAFCLFCFLFPTILGDDMAFRDYLTDF
ncbi:hypothetical protein [Stanieria cyanosphaera]|nr:hypothetical protein [Stanieria cyanosphaera]